MEAELRIAVTLSRRPRALTTIHQLAKLVGKSYSYTYNAIQRMTRHGMVRLQTVGHASLCTLILAHPQVQALLAFADAEREDPKIKQQLSDQKFRTAAFRIRGKQFILVGDDLRRKIVMKTKIELNVRVLRAADAAQWVHEIDFATLEVQCHAAYFWAVVGDSYG